MLERVCWMCAEQPQLACENVGNLVCVCVCVCDCGQLSLGQNGSGQRARRGMPWGTQRGGRE